jgi:hypothetical protein
MLFVVTSRQIISFGFIITFLLLSGALMSGFFCVCFVRILFIVLCCWCPWIAWLLNQHVDKREFNNNNTEIQQEIKNDAEV